MDKFFQTSFFDFLFNYIFSSPWIYGGLTVLGFVTLLVAYATYIDNIQRKSKSRSEFEKAEDDNPLSDSVLVNVLGGLFIGFIVIVLIAGYWTIDTDSDDQKDMREFLIEASFADTSLKLTALEAYEYYIQDQTVKNWEYRAFKDGLVKLKNEDAKYQVRKAFLIEN